MPKNLRIADEFVYALSGVYSQRVLDHIRDLIAMLPRNPDLGSPNVRESLIDRYGEAVRKISVSTLVIVYRVSGNNIDVLALEYGPSVV